jgi:hypothetical protein
MAIAGRRTESVQGIRSAFEVLDELVWEQTQQLIRYPEVVFQEYSRRMHNKQKGELNITALLIRRSRRYIRKN